MSPPPPPLNWSKEQPRWTPYFVLSPTNVLHFCSMKFNSLQVDRKLDNNQKYNQPLNAFLKLTKFFHQVLPNTIHTCNALTRIYHTCTKSNRSKIHSNQCLSLYYECYHICSHCVLSLKLFLIPLFTKGLSWKQRLGGSYHNGLRGGIILF